MRWNGLKSPLATDVVAAVAGWLAVTVSMLILVGGLVGLAPLLGFGTSAAWVVLIGVFGALASLFGGGFISSRLAASRAGVWLLIALLIVPDLLRGRWGGSVWFGAGDSWLGGWGNFLVGLVVLPVAIAFAWLLTVLPVLAGANYERRRRMAAR